MPPTESPPEKPWAILGISQEAARRCHALEKAGVSKVKYAEMLDLIPHEAMRILKDEADAERLVEEHLWTTGQVIKPRESGQPGTGDLAKAVMPRVLEFARGAYPVGDR